MWKQQRKTLFTSKMHLGGQFKEETSKVLHLEHSFVWSWNLGHFEK